MADRDHYRGYGSPSGRYYEAWEYDRGYGDRDRGRDEGRGRRGDDRGVFERAGDEVRSWFSDDDRDRQRDRDQRFAGARDEWRDRDRERDRGYGWSGTMSGRGGTDRNDYQGRREPWGGGDRGGWSGGYETGGSRYGASESYAGGGRYEDRGGYYGGRGGSSASDDQGSGWGGHPHDEHYRDWRRQQIEAFDRDYDEYRRENRDRFHSEFGNWRQQRQRQRDSLRQVREHMEVVGSDGEHIGTVDKVTVDRIVLTKGDASAGGHHHSIPCAWIQTVDERVTIDRTADQARQHWRDEESRRALFENDDQRRNEGPHVLERSFSGTYEKR